MSEDESLLPIVRDCNDNCPYFHVGRSTRRLFCYKDFRGVGDGKLTEVELNDNCIYGFSQVDSEYVMPVLPLGCMTYDEIIDALDARRSVRKFHYFVPVADRIDKGLSLIVGDALKQYLAGNFEVDFIPRNRE